MYFIFDFVFEFFYKVQNSVVKGPKILAEIRMFVIVTRVENFPFYIRFVKIFVL